MINNNVNLITTDPEQSHTVTVSKSPKKLKPLNDDKMEVGDDKWEDMVSRNDSEKPPETLKRKKLYIKIQCI